MSNNITNILIVVEGNPAPVFAAIKGDNCNDGSPRLMDFNRLIPRPACLDDNQPDSTTVDWAKIAMGQVPVLDIIKKVQADHAQQPDLAAAFGRNDFASITETLTAQNRLRMLAEGPYVKDYTPERFESFIKCLRAVYETGYAYWYDWATENWGVKWNAYDCEQRDERTLKFETANSSPGPIWNAIVERFPGHLLHIRWADEDFGSNVGEVVVRGAETTRENAPEYGKESRLLAVDIIYPDGLPDHMRYTEDGDIECTDED